MKVAIVTLSDHYNQGNRLQNYALQRKLQEFGHSVTTYSAYPVKILSYALPLALKLPLIPMFRRMRRFRKFTKQHFERSVQIDFYSKKKLDKLNDKHDAFIVGSDQTWSTAFCQKPYAYYLHFADYDKTIAYAPSFGSHKIDEKWQKIIRNGLRHIKYLSARETEGAQIVEQISGLQCPVVLDPTLLLEKDEWLELATEPRHKPKGKYVLCYFIPNKKNCRKIAQQIAEQSGMELVDINRSTGKYYVTNPAEFISLIYGAEFICTGSFHGHALSVCLEKPFVTIPSTSETDSRIVTLMQTFGLPSRHYKDLSPDEYGQLDYAQARGKLRAKREESLKFLQNALKEIEKRNA